MSSEMVKEIRSIQVPDFYLVGTGEIPDHPFFSLYYL